MTEHTLLTQEAFLQFYTIPVGTKFAAGETNIVRKTAKGDLHVQGNWRPSGGLTKLPRTAYEPFCWPFDPMLAAGTIVGSDICVIHWSALCNASGNNQAFETRHFVHSKDAILYKCHKLGLV